VFGDYEGYREVEGAFVQGNAPTEVLRGQLLRAVPAYKLVLDTFPLPNQPTDTGARVGLFSAAKAARRVDDHYDVKGDILFTSNSRLAVSFNHGDPYRSVPRIFLDDDRAWINTLNRTSVSYTLTRTPWVSETRFGYTKAIQVRTDGFFSQKDPNNS